MKCLKQIKPAILLLALLFFNSCVELMQHSLETKKTVNEKRIPKSVKVEFYGSASVTGEDIAVITAYPEQDEITYDNYQVTTTSYNANWWAILGLVGGIAILTQAPDSTRNATYWLIIAASGIAIIDAVSKDGKSTTSEKLKGSETNRMITTFAYGRSAYLEFTDRGTKHRICLGKFDSKSKINIDLSNFYRLCGYPFKSKAHFMSYLKGGGYIDVDWGKK
jgi:hypothetical protein